jgi:hypothetical protein
VVVGAVSDHRADLAAAVLRADETGVDPHLAFTLKDASYKA